MMKHDIFTLIRQLQEEADKYDAEFKGYEAACVNGMLKSYFKSMHDDLPDDHFLKEYIPEQLAKELDDLKQRAVMKKLES
jgi:hypothetical protein